MLTVLSTVVGMSGSTSGIPLPICCFLRVQQMVEVMDGNKYP